MPEPVFIIGHRNPDADAICSALGYAHYKKLKGEAEYEAARCGNSNARIDAILREFDVPLPRFIGDVTPRVRDIMVENVIKVREDATCFEALELIDKYDIRVLPVVDGEDRLAGTVSIFGLGDHFIPKPREERKMREVFASLNDIVRALNAKVVHAVEPDRTEDLFVRIGAMDIRSFGKYYKDDAGLANRSVIIVGDRYDIQLRCIQSGVRMIVISGNLPIEPDVVELAKERGVSLIVSPNDSATTSWIIRSAGRVDRMVQKEVTTFNADEKLDLVRRRISSRDAQAFMVLDDASRLIGVFTKSDILKPVKTRLVLVDHNELGQAVTGADKVNILEIVDHHRLGNPPTSQPILFLNAPVGSTSTIVADLFRRDNLKPSTAIAGILMAGIISDTLFLKGPTTTKTDVEILDWLGAIAPLPADKLADLIFSAGSVILSDSPEDVIRSDMKLYNEGDVKFSVSQVEELGFENFWNKHKALNEALEEVRNGESLHFSALLVTDINTQNSLLLIRGESTIIESITYPQHSKHDVFELNGVVSRKKQLIPYLSSLLHGLEGVPSA